MTDTKFTVTLEYSDDAELCRKLHAILDEKEPRQERPPAITLGALAALVGRSNGSVSRSLHGPLCPEFRATRGPKGRILRIEAAEPLIDYLGGRKKPTVQCKARG